MTGIPFDISGLTYFSYYESMRGSAWYQYQWQSADMTVDKGLMDPALNYTIQFGYNSQVVPSSSPVKQVMVGRYSSWYNAYGLTVTTEGFDSGYRMAENCSENYFSQQTIDKMVGTIAAQNNLATKTVATDGKFTLPQGDMTDAAFLEYVLLPRAYSGSRNDYFFYVLNGKTLVFQPVDQNNVCPVEFVYNMSSGGNLSTSTAAISVLDRLEISYNRSTTVERGGGNTKYRAFDPYKKQLYAVEANNSTASPVNTGLPSPVFPNTTKVRYSTAPYQYINPDNQQVNRSSYSQWCREGYQLFTLPITLKPGNCGIQPGQVAKVLVTSVSGNKHYSSGPWVVFSVLHNFKSTEFTTQVELMRRQYTPS